MTKKKKGMIGEMTEMAENDTEKTIEEVVDEIIKDVKIEKDEVVAETKEGWNAVNEEMKESLKDEDPLLETEEIDLEKRVQSLETKVEQLIRGKRPKRQRRSLLENPKEGSCIT